MEFIIKNINENIANIARKLGYVIIDSKEYNEYNMVRKLSVSRWNENYPRFHIYLNQAGDKLIFNLHLDQKKPSYKGSHAHSGEYEGPVVENETDRIKQLLEE